jgi:hypothetical protein
MNQYESSGLDNMDHRFRGAFMRTVTAVLSLLFIFVLSACDAKTSFERQSEKDAKARRAVNTGEK